LLHLFYSYLNCLINPFPFRSIPSNHSLSTKRRFAGSACTAPAEGLPPSYLQHWSPSLFELINILGFHSGHTLAENGSVIWSGRSDSKSDLKIIINPVHLHFLLCFLQIENTEMLFFHLVCHRI